MVGSWFAVFVVGCGHRQRTCSKSKRAKRAESKESREQREQRAKRAESKESREQREQVADKSRQEQTRADKRVSGLSTGKPVDSIGKAKRHVTPLSSLVVLVGSVDRILNRGLTINQ